MRVAGFLAEWEELWAVYLALVVTDVVDLEGGMGDAVLAGEEVLELAAAGVAVVGRGNEHVR